MNLMTYARRNIFRRRGRTILTILGMALTILIFSGMRTVVAAWHAGEEQAAADRIATRHKNSIVMLLPRRYIDDVRAIKGVDKATFAVWFGSKDPKKRAEFFAGFAVDHESFFDVMDEYQIDKAQLEDWKHTSNGAVLGDILAKTLQVKVGDKVTIQSDIYPGDWEFVVKGIYKPLRATADRNSFIFRWDYLNNDPRGDTMKDKIGWVLSRITDPGQSAAISKQIDTMFDQRDDQTLTQSERAFQMGWLGMFASLLKAFDIVTVIILLVMALILANTIAMAVRERTHEYGVLRAIGFQPGHVVAFVLGEAFLIGALGGLVGILFTLLLINGVIGPFIEENMGALFPFFRAPLVVLASAFGLATLAGIVAGAYPAWTASRRKVTDALRRVD